MREALALLTDLWPRLLIAPLGVSLAAALWLVARIGGYPLEVRRDLRQPWQLLGPLAALLWLPLPGAAALALTLDLFVALVLCMVPQLLQPQRLSRAPQLPITLLVTVCLYALVREQLVLTPLSAATALQTVALTVIGGGLALTLAELIPRDEPAAVWQLSGLLGCAAAITATVLPWWLALPIVLAAFAVGARSSTRLRGGVAQ